MCFHIKYILTEECASTFHIEICLIINQIDDHDTESLGVYKYVKR